MAFKALIVHILGIDQLVCDGSMAVVAIGTRHLAFPNRMVRRPQQLRGDGSMTTGADFGLGGFCQVFRITLMHIVAIGAG